MLGGGCQVGFVTTTLHIVCLDQMMRLYREILWEIDPVFFSDVPFL